MTNTDDRGELERLAAVALIRQRALQSARLAVELAEVAALQAAAAPEDSQKAKRARRAAAKARREVAAADSMCARADDIAAAGAAIRRRHIGAKRSRAVKANPIPDSAATTPPVRLALIDARPLKLAAADPEEAERELRGRALPRPIARRY
ncbi:MAG: hypothetical protein NVV70_10495 [Cellulomonas sp.]|nr:hypothetical protein [Cellulomonas sp.]MCR6648535.1 hypothetical protein [Cellulomonas sp.]